jgi:hypothetical protein
MKYDDMKYEIEIQKVNDLLEKVDEFEKLLTERIFDLHEIKGMMQARHAYIFYRKLLWEIKESLTDNLKKVKENQSKTK